MKSLRKYADSILKAVFPAMKYIFVLVVVFGPLAWGLTAPTDTTEYRTLTVESVSQNASSVDVSSVKEYDELDNGSQEAISKLLDQDSDTLSFKNQSTPQIASYDEVVVFKDGYIYRFDGDTKTEGMTRGLMVLFSSVWAFWLGNQILEES